jgi:sensor histidine kinase YesM
MRFGERLDVVLRTEDAALDVMVPSLILQPLVENAVKHGVEKLRGRAQIEIEARCEVDALVLRVRDNGPAWDRTAAEGASDGVGVSNTIARLRQLYGAQGSFTLTAADGGGTVAEVRIPVRSPTVLHTKAVPGRDTTLGDGGGQEHEAVRVG